MKKTFLFILGIIAAICLFSNQSAKASVYDQFLGIKTQPFHWVEGLPAWNPTTQMGYRRIAETDFKLNFAAPTPPVDTELDDGYAEVPLGFDYGFNDSIYSRVYVSIDGFITFSAPQFDPAQLSRNNQNLFNAPIGAPINVISPYWGDHKYWKEDDPEIDQYGCDPSEIGYEWGSRIVTNEDGTQWTQRYCLIRWKALNVNWRNTTGGSPSRYYGNFASFQVIIYQGEHPLTAPQGDVEFQYNTLGRTDTQKERGESPDVIMNPFNASAIGVKGAGLMGGIADYLNALYNDGNLPGYPNNPGLQRSRTDLATAWPPSWNATHSIILTGKAANVVGPGPGDIDETWGDGDSDLSQLTGGRHASVSEYQNLFVTMNDVRTILVSVVTGEPLDSAYAKSAFHADVNHDGRYYYLIARDVRVGRIGNRDTFTINISFSDAPLAFRPYYGENNDYLVLDFMGLGTVSQSNRNRTVKIIDPFANDGNSVRVTLINKADSVVMIEAANQTSGQFPEDKVSLMLKKNIKWADSTYKQGLEDLPISDAQNQVYWQADEQDASDILAYLGGQHPALPWWYGNVEYKRGKITPYQFVNGVIFDNAEILDNGIVKVPVYLNGYSEGSISSLFTLNSDIVSFESVHPNVVVEYSNATKRAVFAANGYIATSSPIAYLYVRDNGQDEITGTNVRFQTKSASDIVLKLNRLSETDANSAIIVKANPVVTTTDILLNVANTGNYSLAIYDANGNLVKTLANGLLNAGSHEFTFNADEVADGTYYCRLEGENVSSTKMIVVVR